MKLAFDLLTNLPMHFAPHHWLELVLTVDGAVLESSRGRDTFAYNATVLGNVPVCATGRAFCHAPEPDLKGVRGVPGALAEVELPQELPFEKLRLWLDTNKTMSQGELQAYFSLRCHVDGRDATYALSEPVFAVHWEGQGLFAIDLSPLGKLL